MPRVLTIRRHCHATITLIRNRGISDALVAKLLARPQRRRKLYYHAAAGEPVDIRLPNMSSWAPETEPRRLAKYEPRLAHFGYSLKSRALGALPPALRTILLTE